MCGIIGYLGPKNAVEVIFDGLKRLEHRGYDSAGVVFQNGGSLDSQKCVGSIDNMKDRLFAKTSRTFQAGIGHNRWATHGPPTEANAHPHFSSDRSVAVVHNGIIDNYTQLRHILKEQGIETETDTDTEVIAHLIAWQYRGNLFEAVCRALKMVEGTYGLAVMHAAEPDTLVAARNGSPVLVGLGDDQIFVASDPSAIVGHTRRVIYLNDHEVAKLTRNDLDVVDLEHRQVEPEIQELDLTYTEATKDGYEHFMLKEIYEQPTVVFDAMRGRLQMRSNRVVLGGLTDHLDRIQAAQRLVIMGCGTSWHAALVGEYLVEQLARIPVEVEYASEFRYRAPIVGPQDVVIAISQSGETSDTLAALEHAKHNGALAVGITNVVGSALSRLTDCGVYIHAGPEIGVASTKAFTAQLTVLTLLALMLGQVRAPDPERDIEILQGLSELPESLTKTLDVDQHIQGIAKKYVSSNHFLYLGRGLNFPVALEGALKLKEISYIHAEGYPAAEMKHGPIALIDEDMPVVVINTRDPIVYDKMLGNMQEIKARHGKIITVTDRHDPKVEALSDDIIQVPAVHRMVSPIVNSVPLQLLAYHMAVLRGQNVDRPRNLAKTVTVE